LVTRVVVADGGKCQPVRPRQPQDLGDSGATTGGEPVSQQSEQDEVSRMDDFEVIRERQNVMTALTELTDRYRRLNAEMGTRETLRWMVAP
jgi:hypothetical protein